MTIDSEKKLLELLASITETDEDEIDCDDFIDRAAAYAEHIDPNISLSEKFFAEAKHLRICPDCRDEFETLLAVLRSR